MNLNITPEKSSTVFSKLLHALYFLYGSLAYVTCFVTVIRFMTFLYKTQEIRNSEGLQQSTIGFQDLLSITLPTWVVVDVSLLLGFVFIHSFFCTATVKSIFNKLFNPSLFRSTFVLLSCVSLEILLRYWQSGPTIWKSSGVLLPLHILGWVLIISSAIQMDYLELTGVLQIAYALSNQPYAPIQYKSSKVQALYHNLRHPMLTGGLLMLLTIPVITFDLAIFTTWFVLYQILFNSYTQHDVEYVKSQFIFKVKQILSDSKKID